MEASDPVFEAWFLTRPPKVQALIRQYPDEQYRIKAGAPYGISCPGTIVAIESYNEAGGGRVSIEPENLLPEALRHIHELCYQLGGNFKEACKKRHHVNIDFKWLEPL